MFGRVGGGAVLARRVPPPTMATARLTGEKQVIRTSGGGAAVVAVTRITTYLLSKYKTVFDNQVLCLMHLDMFCIHRQ